MSESEAKRRRITEALFAAALKRPPTDRGRYLAETCGNDTALRTEVESLLRHAAAAGEFLETAAMEVIE